MTKLISSASESSRPIRTATLIILVGVLFGACDVVRLGSDNIPLTSIAIVTRYAVVAISLAFIIAKRRANYGLGLSFTDICWAAFGCATTISALIHADVEGVAIGVWSMLAVPLLFSRLIPCALGKKGIPIVAVALFAAGLLYLAYSVLFFAVTFPYMGALANPNGMGLLSAGMDFALIGLMVAAGRSHKGRVMLLILPASLITSAFVLASGSRTSCLAVLSVAIVAIVSNFRKLVGSPLKLLRTGLVLGFLILIVHPVLANSGAEAIAVLMAKFDKSSKLSDRDEIWAQTLRDVSVWGNGRDYFKVEVGIGAHNSIIEMLGKYGVLAALGMLCVSVSSLYSTFRYHLATKKVNPHSLTPFLIALGFWILASGEMMVGPLGGAINCCFLISSGIANFLPGSTRRLTLVRPVPSLHRLITAKQLTHAYSN